MVHKNVLISIVIPCFNDFQYVEQAINSALNQTYPHKEIIVVDDGSNFQTKEILKQLEPKITKLISQENQGQSKARNAGIEAAKGDYILVLDSDDYLELTFCEKAISFFLNDVDVKIVSCFANLLFEDGTLSVYEPQGGDISDFLCTNNALGTSLFKKSDWVNCGGYDEGMRKGFEDWEFFIRLLKNGGYTKIVQEPLYNYRKRKESTTKVANKNKYELLHYIYTKHKDLTITYYDVFISDLLSRIKKEENEKLKNLQKVEFKIGKIILRPIRFIKSIFN